MHSLPEWTSGHSVFTTHNETVMDQMTVGGKLPETPTVVG